MDNDDFADVLEWLAQMQRDPQMFARFDTRERRIREVVASLRLSGINVKPEWIDQMRRRQDGDLSGIDVKPEWSDEMHKRQED